MTDRRPRRPMRAMGDARGLIGIPIERTTLDVAVDTFVRGVTSDSPPRAHRLVNSYTFALAEIYPAYRSLLAHKGVNLPDGKPLVAALNRVERRGRRFEQVRGPSFFVGCLDQGREHGVRNLFLGGSPELLEELRIAVNRRFPGALIVGMISPPFRPMTAGERADQDLEIEASTPDVVWVGLGTPRQDFEAQRICDTLGVSTAGVGAAFDFVAGTKPEAPMWMRRWSLEWLFRLICEPRRLWRRYLLGNVRFLILAARGVRARSRP